jgi:septal ring factor EnvC (AmiA/AmiB activator)
MVLFADETISQGTSIVACVIAVVSATFAYLSKRDTLKYDARLKLLETDVASCHAERDKQRKRVVRLRQQNSRQQVEIDGLKRRLGETERDREKLHRELTGLKADLAARGVRADSTELRVPDSKHD